MDTAHPRYVILAAFDDSDVAQQVGATAASVAAATPGAEVHLVHVAGNAEEAQKKHAAHVDEFAKRLRAVFKGRIFGHVVGGTPWQAIVQMAANVNADLVVVAPHDLDGIERFAQGSVSEKVARHAHCPVLLARPRAHVVARGTVIEPPCPHCIATQAKSNGAELWCSVHAAHHVKGHTFADYPESFADGWGLLQMNGDPQQR